MARHVQLLLQRLRELGLENRPIGQEILSRHRWGMLDDDLAEIYMIRLEKEAVEQQVRPNLLAPLPEADMLDPSYAPDVTVGHWAEAPAFPVGINLKHPVFVCIAGRTGAGKTVLLRRLILAIDEHNQTAQHPVVMLIIERKPGEFPDLRARPGCHWSHFDGLSSLRISLQCPSGVPLNVWITCLATLIAARAGLIASTVTFIGLFRWLMDAMNAPGDAEKLAPSFRLLHEVLGKLPKQAFSTKDQYAESLLQILAGVVAASGQLFDAFRGLDVEEDLVTKGVNAVFSVANINPPWLSRFVLDLLVSQLLYGRMHRGQRVESPEVLVIIDEADEDVAYAAEQMFPQGAMSPLTRLHRQGREFGLGCCISVGAINPVSQVILQQCNYQFFFAMADANCRMAAARSAQLPYGADAIVPALKPGECLARTPAWPHAFLANIDYVAPCRNVQPHYDTNPHIPSKPLAQMPELLAAVNRLAAEHRQRCREDKYQEHGELRSEARRLLVLAAEHPFWPVKELYRGERRPAPAVQDAIKEELEAGKFATFKTVRIGSRQLLLIELLEKAWNVVGLPPRKLRGRGDLLHRSVAHWLALVGERRGHSADVERLIPGTTHPADSAWQVKEGGWEVFEVVATSSNLRDHLKACLLTENTPVQTVTIVAPQKSELRAIEKQIKGFPEFTFVMDRIRFLGVDDVLKELWP
jgi:hypothetical protein